MAPALVSSDHRADGHVKKERCPLEAEGQWGDGNVPICPAVQVQRGASDRLSGRPLAGSTWTKGADE